MALVSLATVLTVIGAAAVEGANQDLDLALLLRPQSEATHDPTLGTATTTGVRAKLFLPAMVASPPLEQRLVEVAIQSLVEVEVVATWWEGAPRAFQASNLVIVPPGVPAVAVLDLSNMGLTDGPVRIRITAAAPGAVVSRVTLIETPIQPNVVFILVDDMREIELELGFGRALPAWDSALERELVDGGTTFANFFNTTPLCCPSRASYLTGQYAHNHGVYGNNYNTTGGNGGWRRFYERGHDVDSVGTWMQGAGYQTVLIGKYMNGYPNRPGRFLAESFVPPGWDEWYGEFNNDIGFSYFTFRINENGTVVQYNLDPSVYLTDVEKSLALDYLDRVVPLPEPFFMYLAPFAPHGPTQPADRHKGMHAAVNAVTPPSFNEADLSDKPQHVQDGASPSVIFWSGGAQRKLDMTLAVDELIDDLFDRLRTLGELDKTYVFLTSDNGLLSGEHMLGGKSAPYEESIRIPLLVRGPGVAPGITLPHLSLNIDMAPTFLELAGAPTPPSVDGESLVGAMTGAIPSQAWRDAVEVELLTPIDTPTHPVIIPPYSAARTPQYCYVEYQPGDVELYDLTSDPFELTSLHAVAPSTVLVPLQNAVSDLRLCSGTECHDAARPTRPRVAFTATCTSLACSFDAGASLDPDGAIVSYAWSFGDGSVGAGVQASHTYGASDDYSVYLELTDDDGQIRGASQPLSVLFTGSTHVSRVHMILKPAKSKVFAKATVLDHTAAQVPGATVFGDWRVNGSLVENSSAVTNSLGKAKIPLLDPSSGDRLEFCVTDVAHPSMSYDSAANVATCGQALWP